MAITNLKTWRNGETFTARAYVYERDLIVDELNRLSGLLTGDTDLTVNSLQFNLVGTQADFTAPGTLFYDTDKHTLTLITDLGEYLEIGSNLGDFAKNLNGTVYEGQPVTIAGNQGSSPTKQFLLADASVENLSLMVGVLTTSTQLDGSLLTNELGKISVFGDVNVPDWSKIFDSTFFEDYNAHNGYLEGDAGYAVDATDLPGFGLKLYLSATEPGKYTAVEPIRPNTAMWVATITNVQNATKGKIFVNPVRLSVSNSSSEGATLYTDTEPTDQLSGDIWFAEN